MAPAICNKAADIYASAHTLIVIVSEKIEWHAVRVNSKCEKKVGSALTAKGFETFVPLRKVQRQWSDRVKTQQLPLLPGWVFCRFRHLDRVHVLNTLGISPVYKNDYTPVIVPDGDILRLKRILGLDYDLSIGSMPVQGEIVEVIGQEMVRGVVLERGVICRVGICLNSLGQVICLHIPAEIIRSAASGSIQNYIPIDL